MNYILTTIAVLFTIIVHELAHGYSALWMGDDTAKRAGRLTINPLRHIDIAGLICMLIFKFGWAKPVPVNSYNFRDRKIGMLIVSLAGVFTNFVLAILFGILMIQISPSGWWYHLISSLYLYNAFFAIFNILPFPPLDGSKVLITLLPVEIQNKFYKYEKYFYGILVILIFSGAIDMIINPMYRSLTKLVLGII